MIVRYNSIRDLVFLDTNESAQLYESMRSIPIDDLLNVAIDGGFNSKIKISKIRYLDFFPSFSTSSNSCNHSRIKTICIR